VVIRGADKEKFAAALGWRLLKDRLDGQTERIRRYLQDHLREGLSLEDAGQRYCALVSPEPYHLLTVEFGWSPDQHRAWVTALLQADLLGSQSA
jgi:hypothetical protein